MKTRQSFYTRKLGLLLVLMLVKTTFSYSQKPNRKETLSYINEKLGSTCHIDVKANIIIAAYYSGSGEKIREDHVNAYDLDTVSSYDPDEKMIYINCLKNYRNCVTRELYREDVKRTYSRISFVIDDESKVAGLRKALIHLLKIDSQFRYNDVISFE